DPPRELGGELIDEVTLPLLDEIVDQGRHLLPDAVLVLLDGAGVEVRAEGVPPPSLVRRVQLDRIELGASLVAPPPRLDAALTGKRLPVLGAGPDVLVPAHEPVAP